MSILYRSEEKTRRNGLAYWIDGLLETHIYTWLLFIYTSRNGRLVGFLTQTLSPCCLAGVSNTNSHDINVLSSLTYMHV